MAPFKTSPGLRDLGSTHWGGGGSQEGRAVHPTPFPGLVPVSAQATDPTAMVTNFPQSPLSIGGRGFGQGRRSQVVSLLMVGPPQSLLSLCPV